MAPPPGPVLHTAPNKYVAAFRKFRSTVCVILQRDSYNTMLIIETEVAPRIFGRVYRNSHPDIAHLRYIRRANSQHWQQVMVDIVVWNRCVSICLE